MMEKWNTGMIMRWRKRRRGWWEWWRCEKHYDIFDHGNVKVDGKAELD
jgi:hypothetical protein